MRSVQLTKEYTAHVVYLEQTRFLDKQVTLFQVIVYDHLAHRPVLEVSRYVPGRWIDCYGYTHSSAGRSTIELTNEQEERQDVDPLTVALWAIEAYAER